MLSVSLKLWTFVLHLGFMTCSMQIVKKLCRIVHTLITVCGYKTVVKFFPHQASDLEPTVVLLEQCHREVMPFHHNI